ncbi:MAG: adenylosuccinate lyase [Planctomycetes bacterium]|nr:adenylosuccinate lyase [Planctomycetota bacterium]
MESRGAGPPSTVLAFAWRLPSGSESRRDGRVGPRLSYRTVRGRRSVVSRRSQWNDFDRPNCYTSRLSRRPGRVRDRSENWAPRDRRGPGPRLAKGVVVSDDPTRAQKSTTSGEDYTDPLAQRYASASMKTLFSPRRRALAWRDLWIALAEEERALGLPIDANQVAALRAHRDELDLDRIAEHEERLRHDVMAHIHHFGEVAPEARGILHLGATSCFVTDNGDLVLYREALTIIGQRLLRSIHALARFAREHADRPTLGLTHLQPAQLTTVGKRAALWLQDLVDVWREVDRLRIELPFRGVKGTTGTQASYLQLFGGRHEDVEELERRVSARMGFDRVFPLTGQTYSRLWDHRVVNLLCEIGIVLHKMSTDLRLLQSWGEIEEPYRSTQIGSSAMPYKRNPMRAERMGALSKHLMAFPTSVGTMAATQWFERTLDDSALRRLTIPQAFLTADALLIIARNVCDGLIVHPRVIERRLADQLPFIAAEELLMLGASRGGDRQELHERIRRLAWQAAQEMREEGAPNGLRGMFEADDVLGPLLAELPPWEATRFTGRAAEQTRAYLDDVIAALPVPPEDELRELTV